MTISKFITCCLFACPINIAMAQTQVPKGLGLFRLGSHPSIIDSIAKTNGIGIETALTRRDVFQKDYATVSSFSSFKHDEKLRIRSIPLDTTDAYSNLYDDLFCPDVKVYQINRYNVAEFEIKEVTLFYYKDSLYKIDFPGTLGLDKAFELKYGEPVIKADEKPVKCVYKLTGNAVEEKEFTLIYTWEDSVIRCQRIFMKYFDSKCNKTIINNWHIVNKGVDKRLDAEADRIKSARKVNADQKMKEKLSEL